jgi:hypothetical protein
LAARRRYVAGVTVIFVVDVQAIESDIGQGGIVIMATRWAGVPKERDLCVILACMLLHLVQPRLERRL